MGVEIHLQVNLRWGQTNKVLFEHLGKELVMMVQQEEQATSPFVVSNAMNSIIIPQNIGNVKAH